jgi:hypothetical protein
VEEFIRKLYALREESDAHQVGTSEFDLAMFAIYLSGSICFTWGTPWRNNLCGPEVAQPRSSLAPPI